eukprot:5538955-Prymnesium_polylepis.1
MAQRAAARTRRDVAVAAWWQWRGGLGWQQRREHAAVWCAYRGAVRLRSVAPRCGSAVWPCGAAR